MDDRVEHVVGRRLRRRRRLMGLTQSELATACGVSFQQVQKYECAHTRLSVDMLWKLACALEVEVGYFFVDLPRARPADVADRRSFAPSQPQATAA